jgi:PhnB protein
MVIGGLDQHAERRLPDEGGNNMTDHVNPVPDRLHTVTPRMVFRDAHKAIEFYREAFGAETFGRPDTGPDGNVIHVEIRVGDSAVYLTEEGDNGGGDAVAPSSVDGRVTAIMSLMVPDVDQLWRQAVAAGCEVIFELEDQFYGDRTGRLRDPFGHQWILSTHIEDVSPDELERRMKAMMDSDDS